MRRGGFILATFVFVILTESGPALHAQPWNWWRLGAEPNSWTAKVLLTHDSNKALSAGTDEGLWKFDAHANSWMRRSAWAAPVWSMLRINRLTMYAGTKYSGLHSSTDDGETWSPTPFPKSCIGALTRAANGDVYAGSVDVYRMKAGTTEWEALGVCPPVVVPLHGLNFGPYTHGKSPNLQSALPEDTIRMQLASIAPYTRWIRTFDCIGELRKVGALAHEAGLKAAIGIWLGGSDTSAHYQRLDSAIALAGAGHADLVIVGNENLLGSNPIPEQQRIRYVRYVQERIADSIPVTAAETYDRMLTQPGLMAAVDLIMVNVYPFWENSGIETAVGAFVRAFRRVEDAAGGKSIIVSETGWPSGGTPHGAAVPSLENAIRYHLGVQTWARVHDVEVFSFEAFDETWKAGDEGPVGAHWGIFDACGKIKEGMERLFSGEQTGAVWADSVTPCCINPRPTVCITRIPAYGCVGHLQGRVWHVDPMVFKAAAYIHPGSWWNKPAFDRKEISLNSDSTFNCDVVTAGIDEISTRYAVFLLPIGVQADTAFGSRDLPARMYQASVAHTELRREPPCGAFHALLVDGDRILAGSRGGGLWFSGDQGGHWDKINDIPADADVRSIVQRDDEYFLATWYQGIHKSSNGRQWTLYTPELQNPAVLSLATDVRLRLFAGTTSEVSVVDSPGNAWKSAGLDATVYSLAIGDSGVVYAGTGTGVYRTDALDGGVTLAAVPAELRLGLPHPNPSTGAALFDVHAGRTLQVRIALVDLLGREVLSLHEGRLEPGAVTVRFDASGLAAGIYFVQCRSNLGVTQHAFHLSR